MGGLALSRGPSSRSLVSRVRPMACRCWNSVREPSGMLAPNHTKPARAARPSSNLISRNTAGQRSVVDAERRTIRPHAGTARVSSSRRSRRNAATAARRRRTMAPVADFGFAVMSAILKNSRLRVVRSCLVTMWNSPRWPSNFFHHFAREDAIPPPLVESASRRAKTIQHVAPQGMADGQQRVIEVLGGIARHAQPLHHAPRTDVVGGGEGHDLEQTQEDEAERQRGTHRHRGITVAPEWMGQPPAELDARIGGPKGRREFWDHQAGGPDERRHAGHFDRPQTETVARHVGSVAGGGRVALVQTERRAIWRHHPRSAVQGREGGDVIRPPRPQQQPVGRQRGKVLCRGDYRPFGCHRGPPAACHATQEANGRRWSVYCPPVAARLVDAPVPSESPFSRSSRARLRPRSISQTTRIDRLYSANRGPAISTCDSTSGPGVSTPPTTADRISAYLSNFHSIFEFTRPIHPSTASTTGSSNATPVPSSMASMNPTSSSIVKVGRISKPANFSAKENM